jgi:hypothetical protein
VTVQAVIISGTDVLDVCMYVYIISASVMKRIKGGEPFVGGCVVIYE